MGGAGTAPSEDRSQGTEWQAHTGELPWPGGPTLIPHQDVHPTGVGTLDDQLGDHGLQGRGLGSWIQHLPSPNPKFFCHYRCNSSSTSKDLRVTNGPVTRMHLLCCVTGQGFHGSLLTQMTHVGTRLSLLSL